MKETFKTKVTKLADLVIAPPTVIPTLFKGNPEVFLQGYDEGWKEYKNLALEKTKEEKDVILVANTPVPVYIIKRGKDYQSGFIYGWGNFRIYYKRLFYT